MVVCYFLLASFVCHPLVLFFFFLILSLSTLIPIPRLLNTANLQINALIFLCNCYFWGVWRNFCAFSPLFFHCKNALSNYLPQCIAENKGSSGQIAPCPLGQTNWYTIACLLAGSVLYGHSLAITLNVFIYFLKQESNQQVVAIQSQSRDVMKRLFPKVLVSSAMVTICHFYY